MERGLMKGLVSRNGHRAFLRHFYRLGVFVNVAPHYPTSEWRVIRPEPVGE
jgi:hypothetical protein